MASEAIGLIVAFGFWLALQNALILSLAAQNRAPQEFQLQIELNIQGGTR